MKVGRRTVDSILSHNGFRTEVSTGIVIPDGVTFIHPRTFVGGQADEITRLESCLLDWELKIKTKYTNLVNAYGYSFPNEIFREQMKLSVSHVNQLSYVDTKTTLSSFIDKYRDKINSGFVTKKSNGKLYSKRSMDLFLCCINNINEFIKRYGDFDFNKYNLDKENIIGKLAVVNAYDNLCETYKKFLISDKNYGNATTEDTLVKTKFIIKEQCEAHGINLSDRYLMKMKYRNKSENVVVSMSQEQFDWVIDNEQLIRKDSEHISWADSFIDFFIAGLLTGARISDLDGLTLNNLIEIDGTYFLSYTPKKTKNTSGTTVEVPVPDRLVSIFKKNANANNGKLLKSNKYNIVNNACRYCRDIISKYKIFQ